VSKPISWSAFPVAMPGGQLIPHMSAQRRTQMMDALFEGAGGFDRALAWIEADDANYKEFFRMWARGAVKSMNVEASTPDSVEALLARLDAGEDARVINPEDDDGR
jgi:hypothetical protein